jgi:hypothetical protein
MSDGNDLQPCPRSGRGSSAQYPLMMELDTPDTIAGIEGPGRWLLFVYQPTALFSLKASRATSTVGKTLLTPTPYAAKMAFIDVALRHGLIDDPDSLVRALAAARLRIGLPATACVTTTIQRVRQVTRPEDRKSDPAAPPYRTTIAMREVVHFVGSITLAFDLATCSMELISLLAKAAPAINYLGKRGSFFQFCGSTRYLKLDESFTQPFVDGPEALPSMYHLSTLDDFGPMASFDALNGFSRTRVKRGIDRAFVETVVPLGVLNYGFGFVHYATASSPDASGLQQE